MKYTTYALRIFEALEGGFWRSSNEIADAISVPINNLKTAFERLVGDGVIERNVTRSPAQYRRTPEPKGAAGEAAAVLRAEIERERRTSPSVRRIRNDPIYKALAGRAVGYCGLIQPDQNRYGGFFIMPENLAEADEMIGRARQQPQFRPFDNEALANAFAATFATLVDGAPDRTNIEVLVQLAKPLGAISKLMGTPYFFIRAERHGHARNTTIETVDANVVSMVNVLFERTAAEFMIGIMEKWPDVVDMQQRAAQAAGQAQEQR